MSRHAPIRVEEIEVLLAEHFGRHRKITDLAQRRSIYSTSAPILDTAVRFEDGEALDLLVKDLAWDSLLDDARGSKPPFLHQPMREISTYRELLDSARDGTAVCYGAIVEPGSGRYLLLLERVEGVELYQVGEIEIWCAAASTIGAFHARFHSTTQEELSLVPLINMDASYYRSWMRRALNFAADGNHSKLTWLQSRHEAMVIELLMELPRTVIHGELYASNVLVTTEKGLVTAEKGIVTAEKGLSRVCLIDWEMSAHGPGLLDLAALGSGTWSTDERDRLRVSYQRGAHQAGNDVMASAASTIAISACRLQLCLQWLGWSASWTPPPEHTQNWLAEAMELAETLAS